MRSSRPASSNKLKFDLESPAPLPALIAVNYRRVSYIGDRGAPGEGQFLSPEIQNDSFRDLCRFRGWEPDDALSTLCEDLDESAYRKHWSKRPGLVRLLEAARAGKFQVLVVLTVSRLARRIVDFLEITNEFREAGVTVHFVREGLDTSSAFARAMLSMLAVFAEMEAESTSEWRKGVARRRREEGLPQGRYPFWVRKDTASGELVEIPEHAATMRRLYELRRAMVGHSQIARTLNEEGRATASGSVWSARNVINYLSDAWITRASGTAVATGNAGEPILLPGAYPAIITPEEARVLRLVQERLRSVISDTYAVARAAKADIASQRGRGLTAESPYLLSGLLICAACGTTLRASSTRRIDSGKLIRTYFCPRASVDKSRHQSGGFFIAENLEYAVARVMREVMREPPTPSEPQPEASTQAKKPKKAKRRTQGLVDPEELETLADVRDQLNRIAELFAKGLMLDETYNEIWPPLVKRRETLLSAAAVRDAPTAREIALSALQQVGAYEEPESQGQPNIRAAMLALIARVEAPVFRDDLDDEALRLVRMNASGPVRKRDVAKITGRRMLRVYLHPGVSRTPVWDAPIYSALYQGEQLVFPAPPGITEDVSNK